MNDQKIAYGAAGSAVGLGGLAATLGSCCAAPWAVTLYGAALAAAFARLSYLQPFLLGAAALSISGIFWLAYRQRRSFGTPALTIPQRRRLQALAWVTAAVTASLILVTRNSVA